MGELPATYLSQGNAEEWNRWRSGADGSEPPSLAGWEVEDARLQGVDLEGAVLDGATFRSVDLSTARFRGASLKGARFKDCKLAGADFSGADLSEAVIESTAESEEAPEANFDGAKLVGSRFRRQSFSISTFDNADIGRAEFDRCRFNGCSFRSTLFPGARIVKTDFLASTLVGTLFLQARLTACKFSRGLHAEADYRSAHLNRCTFEGLTLVDVDLRGCLLTDCRFDDCQWAAVSLNRSTKLVRPAVHFESMAALEDGSYSIRVPTRDRVLNWARLRFVGELPLLGVSLVALFASMLYFGAISFLNEHRPATSLWSYPIEPSVRTAGALVASLLLAAGSTVYRLWCPERIRSFSEIDWVEHRDKPRILYIAEYLRRPLGQVFVALAALLGGVLALGLVGEQLFLMLQQVARLWAA